MPKGRPERVFAIGGTTLRDWALVQKVTFDTISENWALQNQELATFKKAICDILHQSHSAYLHGGRLRRLW